MKNAMTESLDTAILLQRIEELEKELSCLRKRQEPAHSDECKPNSFLQDIRDTSALLEAAPVAVMVHDLQGRCLYFNRRTLEYYGYSEREFSSLRLSDLNTTDNASLCESRLKTVREQGETAFEINHHRKDGSILPLFINAKRVEWGEKEAILCLAVDITERKREDEALEKRMRALIQPTDSLEGITLEDLFDIKDLQYLQDTFAEATGVAALITHPDGTPITKPGNFCRLCSETIRRSEVGRAKCMHSDSMLGRDCVKVPTVRPCLSAGLWGAGAGISVGGRHLANFLIGQVRDGSQTDEQMREYARLLEVDEEQFVEAFHEVPVMSQSQFKKVTLALFTLASQLSKHAYQNVLQARFINERKRAEQALRESEERYRLLIESQQDLIVKIDLEGRFLYVNPAFCKLFGQKPEELIGAAYKPLVHPDDLQQMEDNLPSSLHQGSFEARARTVDGWRWLSWTTKAIQDETGKITSLIGTGRDITERMQALEAIKLNEARLESLLRINQYPAESLPGLLDFALDEAIALTGSQTGYIYFYDEARNEFSLNTWAGGAGQQTSAAEPRLFGQMIETGLLNRVVQQRQALVLNNNGAPGLAVSEGFNAPGRLHNFLAIPVISEGRIAAVVGVADKQNDYDDSDIRQLTLMMDAVWKIVLRKQAEQEKEKLQVQLAQAQKMESIGRLAGGVAHDFNNMLLVILGHTELALTQVAPDQPLHGELHEILKAAERSSALTQQLLAFARKQTVTPRILDLNETVKGVLNMLKRLIGEDVDLVWVPGKELWPVRFDPSQIDQILANLCINARDAIADTGRIVIEAKNVTLDELYCAGHSGYTPGDYVCLSVSDNGRGMSRETMKNLFEPFFTTKEVGKGTGLGLATVYGIVNQNNSFINVYSEPGQGTTFNIYMARHFGEIRIKPEESPAAAEPPGDRTILLVEDEPAILNLTTTMLERLGYTVLAVSSPAAAINLAKHYTGGIHLLMTDVVMPGMNGRDLVKHLSPIYPDLKHLFMSGYTANVIAHHGVLDRGVHFLQKPFSMRELAAKVRETLEEAD
ncbi:PAS domain S-box protein [bacterium]|nr:PAS domain S-box protein [bacterium]